MFGVQIRPGWPGVVYARSEIVPRNATNVRLGSRAFGSPRPFSNIPCNCAAPPLEPAAGYGTPDAAARPRQRAEAFRASDRPATERRFII